MVNVGTQTGETYDEFFHLASINGVTDDQVFLPGESANKSTLLMHKYDLTNNKLCKITISRQKKSNKFNLESLEFLPESIVEKFLPFNCLMKLD